MQPTRAQLGFWKDFAQRAIAIDLAEERLRVVRDRLYWIPRDLPSLGRLRVVHPGVWLGSMKKDRFEPAHPLALLLGKGQAKNELDLPASDPRLAAYLRGQPIAEEGEPGWMIVAVDGFPLGWGKRVQGVVKNHYPRGWMSG
jgi:NOL1/NOP2/fmu family ribosome biogenesis protein